MPYRGVVAAGHEITVAAAETMLREGGNAFDAILAAHLAACVAEPVLSSLGGGGFLLAWPQAGEPVVYDFFVQTPRHKRCLRDSEFRPIMANFGPTQQQFHIGQGTIATPGTVKGIFRIHRELATLPLSEIAAPAIHSAREGLRLNSTQAYILRITSPIYMATTESREIFCGDRLGARVLQEGEMLRQPQLADTIGQIVVEGEEAFYFGEIARAIVTQSQDEGGHLTREDLEQYDVQKRRPLCVHFEGSEVMTNPPPSSGGLLIAFALELLKASMPSHTRFGGDTYLPLLAHVMQLTSQARLDALANSRPLADGNPQRLDATFLELYRREVMRRARALRGTTHFSVIDAQGNAASMTVSNGEGCGAIVPQTGVMLNNMLGEEDLNVGGFHRWAENERMTSMMAPSLIRTAQREIVATGSGGSNRIRSALLQVIMNLTYFGMDVTAAVNHPRIHLEGDKLSVEGGFAAEQIDSLIADFPDHELWAERNLFFGGAHTVIAGGGAFDGAGDPRRGGVCRVVA